MMAMIWIFEFRMMVILPFDEINGWWTSCEKSESQRATASPASPSRKECATTTTTTKLELKIEILSDKCY